MCVPSTVTGSKCSGERWKLMVRSLVFSRFSWNKFFADQLETWSTASCALLCCPFGTFSDKVVSSTYFQIPKSALGVTRSLITSKKKPRPQFSPLGDTCWYRAPFGQTVTAEFHPLGPIVQDPVNDIVGDFDFLKFGRQSSVINEIKSLAVIEEENTHICAVSVCC